VERLDEAIARLERAVTRLEAACTSFAGSSEAARRVAEAEGESRRLRTAVGEIAGRVDGALARIDRALGEGG
jgi:hypothetical protein